jgi:hypothetical protein
MTAIEKVYSRLFRDRSAAKPGRNAADRGENDAPMRLRRRKTERLTRLLVELDRASADGRLRRLPARSSRVSLLRLS